MKVLQRLIFRARKTFAREVAAGAGTSVLESEAAQQQVADRSGGQCADSDRGASGDPLDIARANCGRATDATTGTTTEFATYITTTTDSGGELPDIQRKWLGIDQDS